MQCKCAVICDTITSQGKVAQHIAVQRSSATSTLSIESTTMSSTGIAVGLNRGFPVTKREVGARPSNSKAVSAQSKANGHFLEARN